MMGDATVHIVDDDASLREALGSLFRLVGLSVRTHDSISAFTSAPRDVRPGLAMPNVIDKSTASTAIVALSAFVAVVQSFPKIPALPALTPSGTEPPFVAAQAALLIAFAAIGYLAIGRERTPAAGAASN